MSYIKLHPLVVQEICAAWLAKQKLELDQIESQAVDRLMAQKDTWLNRIFLGKKPKTREEAQRQCGACLLLGTVRHTYQAEAAKVKNLLALAKLALLQGPGTAAVYVYEDMAWLFAHANLADSTN